MLKWLWVSGVVVMLDQLTKVISSALLTLHEPVAFLPLLNFTLMHNSGAAFSFLSSAGGWQRWFFTLVALVVSAVIIVWLKNLRNERLQAAGLVLILGGALGNLVDRLWHGYVVDFIDFYYRAESCLPLFYAWPRNGLNECHWPAFNIADAAISIGVALVLIDSLRQYLAERRSRA